jgi:hypothetical protein
MSVKIARAGIRARELHFRFGPKAEVANSEACKFDVCGSICGITRLVSREPKRVASPKQSFQLS